MCSITLHINRKNLLGSLIWCLWFSKKEAVYLDRTQSNSLPFIRRKEPLPLFRRRVMAYSFTKRLQFASLSFSLARPCLENSKKKGRETSNYLPSFISLSFVFFSTRRALWCEVSEKSIATSPDVAHNFFLFHGYVYPRINGNSHKPSSPGVGHKYICAYFRSWSHTAVSPLAAQLILPEEREDPKIF
jgi:hypothetical protein